MSENDATSRERRLRETRGGRASTPRRDSARGRRAVRVRDVVVDAGALLLTLWIASVTCADDWPQYRGPDRSGVSREKGLARSWPEAGPRLLWTFRDAGLGFSPPSVVGDRLYTMGTRGKKDFLYALDTVSGRELWATELGPARDADWGDGPCATPTVDGDRLYALTTFGDLHCVETSGKKVWNVHLKNDLQGKIIHDGRFTESPLIDGDRVVCTPGGAAGTIAALDKRTGRVLWRSSELKDEATSASAIRIEVDGIAQYVALTGKGVAAVAAADGRPLWTSDIPAAWIMVATPIFSDNSVFVTTAYGRGCGLIHLQGRDDQVEAREVYRNKVMKNHHGGVVLVDGHLYGHSDPNGWVCQEFATGKQAWLEKERLGKGSLTCVDGLLYCYGERDGTVVLVDASPGGWNERGRFTIPEQTKLARKQGQIWTPPVVANGKLFLRDQDLLFCYDLRLPSDDAEPAPRPDADGWFSLFDGKSLDGWKAAEFPQAFRVEDGVLAAGGSPLAHLYYVGPVRNAKFKDFELKAEVKTRPKGNSGIIFHTEFQEKGFPDRGFEFQINNTGSDKAFRTGGIYPAKPFERVVAKDDEWFECHLLVRGDRVTLKVNGETTIETTLPHEARSGRTLGSGAFAIQSHDPGSMVYFRRIRVKPLE